MSIRRVERGEADATRVPQRVMRFCSLSACFYLPRPFPDSAAGARAGASVVRVTVGAAADRIDGRVHGVVETGPGIAASAGR